MSDDITGLCQDHSFETADEVCRRCGGEFCELCLVFPFGASKPMCKECAMVAGGVRSHSARLEMKGREVRSKVRAFEKRRKRTAERAAAAGADERTDASVGRPVDPVAPSPDVFQPVTVPETMPAESGFGAGEEPPRPAAPTRPGEADVAPPIDWSQPFG